MEIRELKVTVILNTSMENNNKLMEILEAVINQDDDSIYGAEVTSIIEVE